MQTCAVTTLVTSGGRKENVLNHPGAHCLLNKRKRTHQEDVGIKRES
jgi:hypothetical protein